MLTLKTLLPTNVLLAELENQLATAEKVERVKTQEAGRIPVEDGSENIGGINDRASPCSSTWFLEINRRLTHLGRGC